jgi:hypothetical protein
MTGNFFMVCHSEFKMPPQLGGDSMSISYTGYDADKGMYTDTEFTSQGRSGVTQGNLDGDTWRWTRSEKSSDGQTIQQRETGKMLSPTKYRAIFEVSKDGTNWMVMMNSNFTKK